MEYARLLADNGGAGMANNALKSQKKVPTLFYWLSLLAAIGAVVMLFFDWFGFQVPTYGKENFPTKYYDLFEVRDFLYDADEQGEISYEYKAENKYAYVDLEGDYTESVLPDIAEIGFYAVIGAVGLYLAVSLVMITRITPLGVIILGGGVPILFGGGFLIAFKVMANLIETNNLDPEFFKIEFLDLISFYPFAMVMLGTATLVFGLLDRQERRALCTVKNPRPIVMPPENSEIV